jgi:hypothetical protein
MFGPILLSEFYHQIVAHNNTEKYILLLADFVAVSNVVMILMIQTKSAVCFIALGLYYES